MPAGNEEQARDFFVGVLGMREVPKPPTLAARGGAWFVAGGVEIHLGVDADFRPARKAHPAIEVTDLTVLAERFGDAGVEVTPDDEFPGYRRFYVDDPFGNRMEFLEQAR